MQQQQQQQLGLIVEGKEKAAVCWHLATASHYCTDAIKYELDCLRVPRQRRCAPASFFSCMCGERLTLPFSTPRRLQLGHGLCLQIREEQGGQSDRLPIPSRERSLSGLVISRTIYILQLILMQAAC